MASKVAKLPLSVGAESHPGLVRSENQDRMGRFLSPFGELFVVADGMGGHQGGAQAAAMTTDGFEKYLRQLPPDCAPEDALQLAARKINAEIYRGANSGDPATAKMGSTVVLALLNGSRVLIGHAGDSRAYLFRQGRLTRLTRDHSAVQKMIDYNMLTEAEARDHPDASIINRAFGQQPELELEISAPLPIAPGDGLLLCSDGLCGYLDDAVIESAVNRHDDAGGVANALIALALDAGGEDNVTVQFLQFGARSRPVAKRTLEEQIPVETALVVAASAESQRRDATSPVLGLESELAAHLKYPLIAVAVITLLAVGYLLGTHLSWLWGSPAPTPTPTPNSMLPTPLPNRPPNPNEPGQQPAPAGPPSNSGGGTVQPQLGPGATQSSSASLQRLIPQMPSPSRVQEELEKQAAARLSNSKTGGTTQHLQTGLPNTPTAASKRSKTKSPKSKATSKDNRNAEKK